MVSGCHVNQEKQNGVHRSDVLLVVVQQEGSIHCTRLPNSPGFFHPLQHENRVQTPFLVLSFRYFPV